MKESLYPYPNEVFVWQVKTFGAILLQCLVAVESLPVLEVGQTVLLHNRPLVPHGPAQPRTVQAAVTVAAWALMEWARRRGVHLK